MSIRTLRTLVTIYKYGSFQVAAKMAYLSQPAVSQQMKSLENMWGLKIFDRSKRSPKLTSAGQAIAIESEAVIRAYDNIIDTALNKKSFKGDLLLGAVPTTLTGLMPMAISLLQQRYPNLRVAIHPGPSTGLLNQIDRGTIDAGIIGQPSLLPKKLHCLNIAEESMQLLVPPGILSNDPVQLLRTLPFIRFDRDALFGQIVEKWLQQQNIKVKESMELGGLEAISSMVLANLGISIVPKSCVKSMNPLPIKRLPLGPTSPSRKLGLAYCSDSAKLHIIQAAHKALLDAVEIGEFSSHDSYNN